MRSRIALTIALLFLVHDSALAEVLSLRMEQHPLASSGILNFYIGGPPGTGAYLGSAGTIPANGPVEVISNLDGDNTGFISLSARILVGPVGPRTVDLGELGTADITILDFGMSISAYASVTQTQMTSVPGIRFYFQADQGTVRIDNLTGVISSILGSDFESEYDYALNPYADSILLIDRIGLGTVDQGAGLFVDGPEINFAFDDYAWRFVSSPVSIYAGLLLDVHAAVPEVTGTTLLGCVLTLSLLIIAFHRRSCDLPRSNADSTP